MKKSNSYHDLILILLIAGLVIFIKVPYVDLLLSVGLIIGYSAIKVEWKEIGFVKQKKISQTILIAFLMSIVMVLASFYLLIPLLEFFTGQPISVGGFSQVKGNPQLLIVSIGIGWIIGGFTEEIIFRGFLLSRIASFLPGKIGVIIAIAITSIIFGYLHSYQGITGQILIGINGVILGSVYIMNQQKIWLNIFIHGFVNTISMFVLYVGYF